MSDRISKVEESITFLSKESKDSAIQQAVVGEKVDALDKRFDNLDVKVDNLHADVVSTKQDMTWTKKILILILTVIIGSVLTLGLKEVVGDSKAVSVAQAASTVKIDEVKE